MTSDLNLLEGLRILPISAPRLAAAPSTSADAAGWGRVRQYYGPSVVVGEVNAAHVSPSDDDVQRALPHLDEVGQAGVAAFQLRRSGGFLAAKAARPHNGVAWDANAAPGLLAPHPPHAPLVLAAAAPRPAAASTPTSLKLTGKISVGIVIVSGPGALAFTDAEKTKVVAEVQAGLSWLGSQNQFGGVSFYYDIRYVTLNLPDEPNGADKEGYWRVPTMAALGFATPLDYVNSIRAQLHTDWTYCGFFVKYSQTHFAYAYLGGPYLCMQYDNDGWGPDNIDRVFAHESGHIFNAPDEYSSSGCNCTSTAGIYHVPNGNCQSCAPNGGVDCLMRANTWALCSYTPWHWGLPAPCRLWRSDNMGQGSGAVAWLSADVDGDHRQEVVQPWSNNGTLGLIVYKWNGSAMTTLWASGNMGQGSGAIQWLSGDIDGDGRSEIIQLWSNNGTLGLIVYKWNGSAMTTLWASGNMGQGSGAVSWLIGDINGDGRAEIAQQWNNGGALGMIVYRWSGSAMTTLWASGNVGQGSGAVQWLIGDFNGDGRAEIVQEWNNGGALGTIVYRWTGSAMVTMWATGNIGQGAGAVAWLVGDVNGDGRPEIVQQWSNGGILGTIVYGWSGAGLATIWSSGNMGQGVGAVQWLICDINGDGRKEIVQQWSNGGHLGTIVYGWLNGGLVSLWSCPNMGEGAGAVSWLAGSFDGSGRAEVLQQWSNGGALGMIMYGYWANVPIPPH